jgi:hypothetical protein
LLDRSKLESIASEIESHSILIEDSCFEKYSFANLDYFVNISSILGNLDVFERARELVAVQLPHITIAFRFDVKRGNFEMPIELESLYRERLHFHISVEGMVVLD